MVNVYILLKFNVMFSMDQDEKITIRISREALAEIDEFLETRQDLGTRSEFIRSACLRYIQQSRMGQDSKNGKVCVKLRGLTEKWLDKSVSLGLFSDLEDAVSSVITVSPFLAPGIMREKPLKFARPSPEGPVSLTVTV